MIKLRISLFLLIIVACPVFANEVNKVATPHGTTQHNSDQRGTSGVDAGATAKPVASANIVATKNTENENNGQKTKSKTIVVNDVNKVDTPQGTTQHNNDQRGTSSVDAGATANPVASANNEQKIGKTATVNYVGVKEIPFADNEQIRVVLSNRDINRVFVTGDKIKTIHGPTGLYTAKNDNSDPFGSAYLSIYADTSFTIFLATVKGHNFSLLVTPKTLPGRTIILEPTTPALFAGTTETDGYQKMLIDLISNMLNLEPSEDYEYFSISEAKKHKWIKNIKKTNFYNVANIIPVAFYRGEKLSGIISKIENRTKNPLPLKPSYFYQPGVKAIALSLQIISPLESCWLYQIVGQD